MTRRQSVPRQWLVIAGRSATTDEALGRMPMGSGIFVTAGIARLPLRLRLAARRRGLRIVEERTGAAARVHNPREIRQARLRGAGLLFLSPIFATTSHPEWAPLPRMHAAALARLGGHPLIALGGMNAQRFSRVRRLGFHGWAGIDAWKRQSS